ncbi:MAG: ABC transporter substrate-binding protein [Parerythrobacter sp.]
MRSLAAFLLAAYVAGCSVSEPPVRTPADTPKIVSLNPCTDAVLARIAPPEQVLALSHYSRNPAGSSIPQAEARRYGVTGGTVEEVLALDPDVVVAGSFLPPATRAAFADLDIRIETFAIARTVADSTAQVRRLGAIAGRDAEAVRIADRIEAAALPDLAGKRPNAVLWQPGGIVPGEGELIDDLLARAGFTNHSAARGLDQASYLSLERVVADPPDVLLVAGDARAQRHPALRAAPVMRVERFDPSLLYCGGPTIIDAMARLRNIRG